MEEIDPLLSDLIADLNAAGYETFCSCQGKTSERDFEDERHCDRAFVTLSVAVLRRVRVRARRVGLHVCFRNRFVTSLGGDEKDDAEVMSKNLDFPAKMRELFE